MPTHQITSKRQKNLNRFYQYLASTFRKQDGVFEDDLEPSDGHFLAVANDAHLGRLGGHHRGVELEKNSLNYNYF